MKKVFIWTLLVSMLIISSGSYAQEKNSTLLSSIGFKYNISQKLFGYKINTFVRVNKFSSIEVFYNSFLNNIEDSYPSVYNYYSSYQYAYEPGNLYDNSDLSIKHSAIGLRIILGGIMQNKKKGILGGAGIGYYSGKIKREKMQLHYQSKQGHLIESRDIPVKNNIGFNFLFGYYYSISNKIKLIINCEYHIFKLKVDDTSMDWYYYRQNYYGGGQLDVIQMFHEVANPDKPYNKAYNYISIDVGLSIKLY